MQFSVGRPFLLPRRCSGGTILVQQTEAGLQVLPRPGRNKAVNELTIAPGIPICKDPSIPVAIYPLSFPVRTAARGSLSLLAMHLPPQGMVDGFGIELRCPDT